MTSRRFWALVLFGTIAATPSLAQEKLVVISEIDVWAEPGQIVFTDPSSGCRFTGSIDKGETMRGLASTSIVWRLTIDTKMCGSIRTSVSASIRPTPHSPESSQFPLLLLKAGQQALLETRTPE